MPWENRGAVKGTAKRRPTARGVCWLTVGRSLGVRSGPIGLGPPGRVCPLPIPCNQTGGPFCVLGRNGSPAACGPRIGGSGNFWMGGWAVLGVPAMAVCGMG